MRKLYLIGDCQSTRIYENHIDGDFIVWGKGGMSAWNFNPKRFTQQNLKSSSPDSPRFNRKKTNWREIQDDSVIMFWFGYIDVKYLLPKYNNADECAKKYIGAIMENFPNSKKIILEPHPQFLENMILSWEDVEEYSYADRMIQNDLFSAALFHYAGLHGLEVITQKQILECIGVDQLTIRHANSNHIHVVDGLKEEYTKKIYDMLIKYNTKQDSQSAIIDSGGLNA